MHSATKFLGGHGTSLGGVDRRPRHVRLHRRCRSAGRSSTRPTGACPAGASSTGSASTGSPYIALVKTKYVHDLGPSLSAFNAFQLLQGLETLDLRVARHSATALGPQRASSSGTPPSPACTTRGSESSPWHELPCTYLPRGAASVFSFDLHSTGDPDADFARVEEVIGRLRGRAPRRQHRRRAQPRRAPGLDDAQPPVAGRSWPTRASPPRRSACRPAWKTPPTSSPTCDSAARLTLTADRDAAARRCGSLRSEHDWTALGNPRHGRHRPRLHERSAHRGTRRRGGRLTLRRDRAPGSRPSSGSRTCTARTRSSCPTPTSTSCTSRPPTRCTPRTRSSRSSTASTSSSRSRSR